MKLEYQQIEPNNSQQEPALNGLGQEESTNKFDARISIDNDSNIIHPEAENYKKLVKKYENNPKCLKGNGFSQKVEIRLNPQDLKQLKYIISPNTKNIGKLLIVLGIIAIPVSIWMFNSPIFCKLTPSVWLCGGILFFCSGLYHQFKKHFILSVDKKADLISIDSQGKICGKPNKINMKLTDLIAVQLRDEYCQVFIKENDQNGSEFSTTIAHEHTYKMRCFFQEGKFVDLWVFNTGQSAEILKVYGEFCTFLNLENFPVWYYTTSKRQEQRTKDIQQ